MIEEDYKIEVGTPSDIQKKLNQWKHDYLLIIEASFNCGDGICIIIKRIKSKI